MTSAAGLDRYEGHILGLATADGRRVVVGRWVRSPWGPFADVMTQDARGHRTLLAPGPWVADEVAATYVFDEVVVTPVRVRCEPEVRRWHVTAGRLTADVTLGGRTPLGALLTALPRALTRSRVFAEAVDPVASRVVPGVRTVGSPGTAAASGTARPGSTGWSPPTSCGTGWGAASCCVTCRPSGSGSRPSRTGRRSARSGRRSPGRCARADSVRP